MQSCKDFDPELSVGTGLFFTEFMVWEVTPTWGKTKTIGTVVVSLCSTTRGLLRNRGIFLGLVSSRYRVVSVISVGAGSLFAESEI